MIIHRKILIIALVIVAVVLLLFGLGNYYYKINKPEVENKPDKVYDETIVVVTDQAFEPYSYLDSNNNPTGHDIEVIYDIASVLKINVDIRPMSWEDCLKAMKDGEADLILGVLFIPNETYSFQLSVPVNNDTFVAYGKREYSGISELYGKRLAIVEGSEITSLFLKPYKLDTNVFRYESYEEAFLGLENNECDYVITNYSIGRKLAVQYNDIRPIGDPLVDNQFCIGVSDDNEELLNQINDALTQLRKDQRLDKLKDKWLGNYLHFTGIGDFLLYYNNLVAIVAACVLFVALIFVHYGYQCKIKRLTRSQYDILVRASKDPLIESIFNRAAGEELINKTLSQASDKSCHAFFMIDVDNFKEVNDTFGHDSGDQVLVETANRIKAIFREYDIIMRLGGDEFCVFMTKFTNISVVDNKARKLVESLNRSIPVKGNKLKISVSVGVVSINGNSTFDDLYSKSDKALYEAKNKGKNTYVNYIDSNKK